MRTILVITVLGLGLGAGLVAAEPPARISTVEFATEREARYWDALLVCREELEIAQIRVAAEREKTRTATVVLQTSCPEIPPCPAAESCALPAVLGSLGGVLVGGVVGGGVCALK